MIKRQSQTGNLLLTLIVASLALLLVSLALGVLTHQSVIHKTLSTKTRAQNAAKSITIRGVAEFQMEPEFGTPAHSRYDEVLEWESSDGSTGKLTFDPEVAKDLGIPHSTNNFEGENPVPGGAGFDVPPGTVELIGYGEAYGESRVMRNIISVPPYDFAVATNGGFASNGTLLVGALPAGADPTSLDLADLLPAHLGAAGDVTLEGQASILGNVQSGSKVLQNGTVDIRGEIYQDTAMPEIPTIDIETYRTDVPYSGTIDGAGSVTLDENTMHTGDVNLVGTLTLNDAVLFVDGNLTVQGGASGVGAIITTGNITFNSAADFTGNEELALLAQGDVTLKGTGTSSLFQGLVYTEGRFLADNLTVLGSFVSHAKTPPGTDSFGDPLPQIQLNNVQMIQADSQVQFSSKAALVAFTVPAGARPQIHIRSGTGSAALSTTWNGSYDNPQFSFKNVVRTSNVAGGNDYTTVGTEYVASSSVPIPDRDDYSSERAYTEDWYAAVTEMSFGLRDELRANWDGTFIYGDFARHGSFAGFLQVHTYNKPDESQPAPSGGITSPTGGNDTAQTEVKRLDFDFNKFINMRSSVRSVYLGPVVSE